ncbi:Importin-4 [Armadillidium nasatum]|uniref:Importin-4 n=1 Tax=Armadillidium nasatum TaxID=96803 RepID=A0A5N5T0N5_9CRUS|nr:Importin-4 [Armadillidium nasatum]
MAPALPEIINKLLLPDNDSIQELGIFVVSVVSGIAADQLAQYLTQFLHLFPAPLTTDYNSPSSFYTIQALTNFAPIVGQDHMEAYQKLLPGSVEVVKSLIQFDEEKAAQAMDLFDVLAECEVALLVPQLQAVIQLCIEVSGKKDLGNPLRTKALTFLGYITRLKKKYVVKNKMSEGIIRVLFSVLCEKGDDDDAALGFLGGEEAEGGSPVHAAAQSLDSCALHLPPDKILPVILSMVDMSFKSDDPLQIKGAYLSLAMIAEGCADTLRTKHLNQLLQCISRGISSEQQVVKNSALFALGQFAEHLQPDISKYHAELLPVLFAFLREICTLAQSGKDDPPGVDRMFYALEVFCEHLEDELLPHLPALMDCLLSILSTPSSVHLKELAISAIGATANAAKSEMVPYFEKIVALLKTYLTEDQPDEKLTLQVQSLDTLAQLSRSMGAENFLKYADDCCVLGLGLLDRKDDPDVRKTCYLLFASLASVVKGKLANHLPKLIDYMIASLQSVEGVVTHFKDGDATLPPSIEGLGEGDSEAEEEDGEIDLEDKKSEEEDEEVAGYSVENSYMAEKEDTCVALRELSLHCGDSFVIYLDRCAEEVYKMLNYPHEDVRQAAVGAMAQFAVTLVKSSYPTAREGFTKWIQVVVPKLSELIRTDEEYGVVMAGLEGFAELLREGGPAVLQHPGHLQAIINSVTDVMTNKTVCQDMADEVGSDEDGEAEQDEMLVEYAGEVIPNLGKALGPLEFSQHFPHLLPLFANKTKKSCSVAERSFSIGTLAETVEALGPSSGQFLNQLLPIFLQSSQDEDDEVRSNALFGLGVLGQHGGEQILEHFPILLNTLSRALSKETFPRALDNISGAVARLIIRDVSRVPMEQVFPVLLRCLPLREDFEENKTLFQCLLGLQQMKHPVFLQHVHPVLKLCTLVFNTKQSDPDTDPLIRKLVTVLKEESSTEFEAFVQSIEPEWRERVQLIMASNS